MRFFKSLNGIILNDSNFRKFVFSSSSSSLKKNMQLGLGLGLGSSNSCISRSIVSSCRAVLLPRFGGADVLEIRDNVSVPELKPNEVLVRARAVSVNPLDLRMRTGYGRSVFEPLLPIILGRDVSGEVAAVGNSVRSVSVGEEVFGALHPTAIRGTYTDYAILSAEEVTKKPAAMSHVDACVIPFAALTAWRGLKGGGAVGFSAIQLSVAAGCHVTTTVGGESVERVMAVGAEQAVDYTTEDCDVAIKGKFDAVLDTIGVPETERLGVNILRNGGHYMTLQGEAASLSDQYGLAIGLPMASALLMKKQIQYRYSHGIEYCWTFMRADSEGLQEIRRLAEHGKLKVPVEKTFPILQVREAHKAKDNRIIPGKVVLEFD
ncbi:Reticulon-4-interacting protein 1-like protein mitochondrial [Bienertia sinuspersici]